PYPAGRGASFFLLRRGRPPRPSLFPYTTLFRSNGYGASVVKLPKDVAGGTWDLWELAVIRFYGDKPTSYRIVYDTPITNDVVSYLLWADVEEYLEQIKALEAKEQ